jgi:hypothetical protein
MSGSEEGNEVVLVQDQVAGLVKLIPWLYDPIGSTHANRKKTRPNHNGVQTPGVSVISEIC